MKIGIDLDDVIVEFVRPFLDVYEKESGKKVKIEDVSTYNIWEHLNISKEAAIAIADKFYESDFFVNNDLIEGAKEFIDVLSKGHEVLFVTSRPQYLKEKTTEFIEKNFPNSNFEIIHTGDFSGKGKTKAEICVEKNIDVLIEDNKNYVFECAEKGVLCFLVDKTWNQNHEEHEKIIRVKSFNEILEMIK